MPESFLSAVIGKIRLAIFVTPGKTRYIHSDRPSHGFVINNEGNEKEYRFSDGTILKTKDWTFFYLPKGSTYRIHETKPNTGCWAINFDLAEEIDEAPFAISFQNPDPVLKDFHEAVDAFQSKKPERDLIIRRNLYDILIRMQKEIRREYVPGKKARLLDPALEEMNRSLGEGDPTVRHLADLCGISETYFRRIFTERFGKSPKEYLIDRRIDYAKTLLSDGQFTVAETAQMCGFSDPCQFSRAFARKTGASPRQYRSENEDSMKG